MKDSLAYLRAAAVGFALFAGGMALYRNRDRLKKNWKRVSSVENLKDLSGDLSVGKLVSSVGSIRELANQFAHLKQT